MDEMKPVFIISLDCEGKWGLADVLNDTSNEYLSNKNLIYAYGRLLELFSQYSVKATFAFVGALTFSVAEYEASSDLFADRVYQGKDWLAPFKKQYAEGNVDGWLCPELLEMAMSCDHEIATHGFSHLPFEERAVQLEDIDSELSAIKKWQEMKRVKVNTMVFPRNIRGFVSELSELGLVGFRNKTIVSNKKLPKLFYSIIRELAPWPKSQSHSHLIQRTGQSMLSIPGGFFFNWRCGPGRFIPKIHTVSRWKKIIDHAMHHGQVVHLWTHPHNFIKGVGQFAVLESVLQYLDQKRNDGRIVNMTQEQYVSYVGSSLRNHA